MKLFALYLSSRRRTVKSTSRAGRVTAKFPARRKTWKTARSPRTGIETHPEKAEHAQHGQKRERQADPEPFQQPPREQELHDDRECIHRQIELREEGRPQRAIVELMPGNIGLLEINDRGSDRVQEHESRRCLTNRASGKHGRCRR